MKKFFLLFIAVMSLAACQKKDSCRITGEVVDSELNGRYVYFVVDEGKIQFSESEGIVDFEAVDSALIHDGRFSASLPLMEGRESIYAFVGENHRLGTSLVYGEIYFEEGDISVKIDENHRFAVSGGRLNDLNRQFELLHDKHQNTLLGVEESGKNPEARYEEMIRANEDFNSAMVTLLQPYYNTSLGQQLVEYVYLKFSDEQFARLTASVDETHKDREERQRQVRAKAGVGSQIGDISMPNVDGDIVSVNDIVSAHDYTLIDFWASWCGPCMRSMPGLKEVYAEFGGDRFEIVGISLDKRREDWVRTIEEKQLQWIQLSQVQGWNSPIVSEYFITSIPATMLVNGEGRIVARNVSDTELRAILGR